MPFPKLDMSCREKDTLDSNRLLEQELETKEGAQSREQSLKDCGPPAYRPRPGLEPSSLQYPMDFQLWPVNIHWSLLHPGNYWIWEEMVSAPGKT